MLDKVIDIKYGATHVSNRPKENCAYDFFTKDEQY